MLRTLKQRLLVLVSLAALLGGCAVAAMAATGNTSQKGHHAGHHAQVLEAAASYIGISKQALVTDLRSGKSLDQVALAAGKTQAGLLAALKAVAGHQLEERLTALAQRRRAHGHHGAHALRTVSAEYLGITKAELGKDLHAGKSPAQVADETAGRSKAGLEAALLAKLKHAQTSRRAAAGRKAPSPAAAQRISGRVQRFLGRSHKPMKQGKREAAES